MHALDLQRQHDLAEKERLASKLHALELQRQHNFAEFEANRQSLEGAIADTARLSDDLMSANRELRHFKTQAEGYKSKFQRSQDMLCRKEEELKEEVNFA